MRRITFKVPASTSSGATITLTEQEDGTIRCEIASYGGSNVDISGLFFDVANAGGLSSLSISGAGVLDTVVADDAVTNLGPSINMNGANGGVFDAGVSFGPKGTSSADLTFSSSAGPLTLDDFSHVDFGIRFGSGGGKATVQAPAAPNAIDDAVAATEDVQLIVSALENDTDADGEALSISAASDPAHGTVTIASDGLSVVYTADPNYSGSDTFTYQISDGHGGEDSATVTVQVVAVADIPDSTVTASAGANAQQILLCISSSVADADGSEFIDRIEFTGLPAGATIVEAPSGAYDDPGTPGTLVRDFTLSLQPGQDFDFDLGIRTVSRELSNGSEAFDLDTVHVQLDSGSFNQDGLFTATNQSIWATGSEFVIDDERFIGFDESLHSEGSFGPLDVSVDAALRAGFASDLHFEGGQINATLPYNVAINSSYNHTTDTLSLDADAILTGGSFSTQGPTGSYQLDLILEYLLGGSLVIDLPILDPYTIFDKSLSGDYSRNLIDVDSNSSTTISFPLGIDGTVAWPNISTQSDPGLTSAGASNDFLHVNLDIDQAISDIFLGGANPFDFEFDFGAVWGDVQLLDADIFAGLNFSQDFALSAENLQGRYLFENGVEIAFDAATPLQLSNASSYDADGDGAIEFGIELTPLAQLSNNTELGIDLGYNFDLIEIDGAYDVFLASDTFSIGPVVDLGEATQLASFDLYDQTFELNFTTQTFDFVI